MSWHVESGMRTGHNVLQKLFKGRAKITNHFVLRMYQRFTMEQRRVIIRELYELANSGMQQYLLAPGETDNRVIVSNNYVMAVAWQNDKLLLKTIFLKKPKHDLIGMN